METEITQEHTQNQRPKRMVPEHDTVTLGSDDTLIRSGEQETKDRTKMTNEARTAKIRPAQSDEPTEEMPPSIKRTRSISEITNVIEHGLDQLPPAELRQFIKKLGDIREKNVEKIRAIPREISETGISFDSPLRLKRKESDTRLELTLGIARMKERENRLNEKLGGNLDGIADLPEIDFVQMLNTISSEDIDDLLEWLFEKGQLVGEKMSPLEEKTTARLTNKEHDALKQLWEKKKKLGSKYLLGTNYLLEREKTSR